MLKLRKFKPSDAEQLRPSAIDNDGLSNKQAELNATNGPAYTAFKDEQIIGAAGIRLLDDHTGVLWAVFSTTMKQHVRETLRSSRELLTALLCEFDLKTVYAMSKKGLASSQRLLEHLGFSKTDEETKTHFQYKLEI